MKIAAKSGLSSTYVQCEEDECLGINSQLELSVAERKFQDDFRKKLMASGVSMPSPETCFFSYDTKIKSGCVIEPNVVFGTGVKIQSSTIIKSYSYIEGNLCWETLPNWSFCTTSARHSSFRRSKSWEFC